MQAVGIGEVLWDLFPDGKRLGGAPLNFAHHARCLGGSGAIASRIGADDLGAEIVSQVSAAGLETHYLQVDPARPTGTVTVELSSAGVPDYTIHEDVAWDRLEMTSELEELAAGVAGGGAVCFGTLAQREEPSRSTIRSFLAAAGGARRIFDANFRQGFYSKEVIDASLELAGVVKLNEAELEILSPMLELSRGDELDRLRELVSRYDLEAGALTLGPAGCIIAGRLGAVRAPAPQVEVVDTVGAGDAFSAALAVGLAEGMVPEELARFCNLAGAYVATRAGGTPPLDRETLEEFGRAVD